MAYDVNFPLLSLQLVSGLGWLDYILNFVVVVVKKRPPGLFLVPSISEYTVQTHTCTSDNFIIYKFLRHHLLHCLQPFTMTAKSSDVNLNFLFCMSHGTANHLFYLAIHQIVMFSWSLSKASNYPPHPPTHS